MPKITEFDRQIIVLHQQGHSQREIGKQPGYSRCGIQAVIKNFEELREIEDKKRTGRPRKLSKSDEKFVFSLRDRRKSSKDLAQHLAASSGWQVDPSTVRRSLISNGLCGRLAAEKPLFQKGNREKRLTYAKAHKDWNEDQWKRILWSIMESKFDIFGYTHRLCEEKKRWREKEEWVLVAFSETRWRVCPGLDNSSLGRKNSPLTSQNLPLHHSSIQVIFGIDIFVFTPNPLWVLVAKKLNLFHLAIEHSSSQSSSRV